MRADYRVGDYRVVAERLRPAAERLVDEVAPEGLVVDVGCGTGNVAGACAVRGLPVVAVDVVAEQLVQGRASVGGAWWLRADAAALPLRDGKAAAALSTFALIYVDDADRAVAEMARVCAAGGTLGLTAWARGGFQDGSAAVFRSVLPEPYDDGFLRRWGAPEDTAARLAAVADDVTVQRVDLVTRYASVEDWWERTARRAPALVTVLQRLPADAADELGERLRAVARETGRVDDDGFAHTDAYLLAHGRARPAG